MLSSPQHQHDTTSASSSRPTRSSQDKRSDKKTETIPASTPRQPDEIEEADTTVPVKTYQPNPKQKQKRAESSSDKDTDDAESVYLSSDEDTSDEDSSDYDSDSQVSVEELPPRQLSRRAADRSVKTATGSPFTVTQTRSETTRWVSTQSNGGMVRGARTVNQQTTLHGHNVNGPQRRPGGRNSISFNMSVNVDMSFNGFVTGRNLGFTGGSLSYAWSRRNTQGG